MSGGDVSVTPWYKEPWPWLLMAGPGIVVIAAAVTAWLAIRSDDGLVADDYYRQGLAINRTLDRSERARELGIRATIELAESRDRVRARIGGSARRTDSIRLVFAHSTRAGHDQTAILRLQPDGAYLGSIGLLPPGTWKIVAEDVIGGWRVAGTLAGQSSRVELLP